MTTLGDELEKAVLELEDELARNHVKIVIEGDWDDLWGELTITIPNGAHEERETYFSSGADSVHSCLIEMVENMILTRKREAKQ
jgi:hypothetical protein